jgi:hypothetical protein
LGLAAAPRPASADTTTVRIVPLAELGRPAGGAPAPGGELNARLDHKLPSSVSFIVSVRLGDLGVDPKDPAKGVLDVWPQVERACTAPPLDLEDDQKKVKQYHQLGMSLGGAGSDGVLSATVPPLQIDQRFCFSVRVEAPISVAALQMGVRKRILAALAKDLLSPERSCALPTDGSYFVEPLLQGVGEVLKMSGDQLTLIRDSVIDGAQKAQSAFLPNGPAACRDALAKRAGVDATMDQVTRLKAITEEKRAAVVNLSPPFEVSVPLVAVSGKDDAKQVVAATELLVAAADPKALKEAADQLDAQGSAYKPWAELLSRVVAAPPGERAKAVRAAQDQAQALQKKTRLPLKIWSGSGFVDFAVYKGKLDVPEQDVAGQLDHLPEGVAGPVKTAMKDLVQAEANQREREGAVVVALQASAQARDALEKELLAALTSNDVRQSLHAWGLRVPVSALRAEKETPDAYNFASPDFGIAVGVTSGGSGPNAMVLPYVVLNLYAAAVDRTIPVSEITGTGWQRFSQFFSVSFGLTLAPPSVPGRTVVNPLSIASYPVLAGGVRVSQYMRVTGGAVFYSLADPNPAVTQIHLRGAPFLGFSLDADVVSLLTKLTK